MKENKKEEVKDWRQELFNYFSKEHNITLMDDEMNTIENIINPKKYPYPMFEQDVVKEDEIDKKLEKLAKKIIGRLNGFCIMLDRRGLGLPVIDESAMIDMENIIIKIILRDDVGKQFLLSLPSAPIKDKISELQKENDLYCEREILFENRIKYLEDQLQSLPSAPIKKEAEEVNESQDCVSREEYEHAINHIGQLQEQLKEAEDEIRDLNKYQPE